MVWVALFLATCFLAYANGANDNFKGVATLFGSQTTSYRVAIAWATATTFLGSVCSIVLAEALLKNFSGKGLVPNAIADGADFHLAVALGAGITVILATFTGFPISTTHGLTGALVGAGLVAIGTQVNFAALGSSFVLPLLLSPLIAILLGGLVYAAFQALRIKLGIEKEWCICVGETQQVIPMIQGGGTSLLTDVPTTDIEIDSLEQCKQRYRGHFLSFQSQALIDTLHFLSAGLVSFARGLNDTPKIVALLLITQAFSVKWGMLAVALGMAMGGWLNARKVATTMSQKITKMNAGQGFSANLVTAGLVIAASRYGLPVSTTHVSVGSIFGGGLVSRQANWQVFYQILLSWLLTLPIAAVISGAVYSLLRQ